MISIVARRLVCQEPCAAGPAPALDAAARRADRARKVRRRKVFEKISVRASLQRRELACSAIEGSRY